MSDMNLNNPGLHIQTGNRNVKINGRNIIEALENIAAPVFDFFIKTQDDNEPQMFSSDMVETEMLKYEQMQNMLAGEKHKINIVW